MTAVTQSCVAFGTRAGGKTASIQLALKAAARFAGCKAEAGTTTVARITRTRANTRVRGTDIDAPGVAGWTCVRISGRVGCANLKDMRRASEVAGGQIAVALWIRAGGKSAAVNATAKGAVSHIGGEAKTRAGAISHRRWTGRDRGVDCSDGPAKASGSRIGIAGQVGCPHLEGVAAVCQITVALGT